QLGRAHDPPDGVRVVDKVLAERLGGTNAQTLGQLAYLDRPQQRIAHSGSLPNPASRSVPVGGLRMTPRRARRAVHPGDVVQAPGDLGCRVGLPVGANRGHLVSRQRLWDAVGTTRVGCICAPATFLRPEADQAGELVSTPA